MLSRCRNTARASSSRSAPFQSHIQCVGEVTPQQYGIVFTANAHHRLFDQLKKRGWESTRFLDLDLLDKLGVREDIMWMVERIGWTQFLILNELTYNRFTIDFLSTLQTQILSGPRHVDGTCTFQLANRDWKLNLNDINRIFGFPEIDDEDVANAARSESRAYWLDTNLWGQISSEYSYEPTRAKATVILNPAIRKFHHYMAHTIFGHGDGGNNVTKKELTILYAIFNGKPINSTGFLMGHLASVENKGSRGIAIGGIVTKIVKSLNIRLNSRRADLPTTLMNFAMFNKMKVLHQVGQDYYCVLGKTNLVICLPDPERTSV